MTDHTLTKCRASESCSENLYLGIDGGGTKTEFVLVSANGQICKRIATSGSNPNDVGFDCTEALVMDGISKMLGEHPTIAGIFCGIAGMATGNHAALLTASINLRYPQIKVQVASDALNLFAFCDEANMIVISGTGSVVFVKNGDSYTRLGGWGYLFDSAGSAYDIGRAAIRQALKEEDSLQKSSHMSRLLYKQMGTENAWAHVNTLYAKGKPYIASFASVVFEAYRAGDLNAVRIIDESAAALASLLNSGVELYGANALAVASGGLFEHYPDVMCAHLKRHTDVKLNLCDLPPIYGACRKSCAVGGAQMSEDFYQNFKKSYGEINNEYSKDRNAEPREH